MEKERIEQLCYARLHVIIKHFILLNKPQYIKDLTLAGGNSKQREIREKGRIEAVTVTVTVTMTFNLERKTKL